MLILPNHGKPIIKSLNILIPGYGIIRLTNTRAKLRNTATAKGLSTTGCLGEIVKKKALYIEVLGARVHNLRNIDVTIPRNKLTVITG